MVNMPQKFQISNFKGHVEQPQIGECENISKVAYVMGVESNKDRTSSAEVDQSQERESSMGNMGNYVAHENTDSAQGNTEPLSTKCLRYGIKSCFKPNGYAKSILTRSYHKVFICRLQIAFQEAF
ncbi:hypothetical protein VNO78_23395 [Psophocarpus tetragonolobus]|uniref:Uncharacterized protein n=1 Tax=Psophocarpus tetragonolobus TaxID=3891 RepID=A0AAN9XEE4_PSOTE